MKILKLLLLLLFTINLAAQNSDNFRLLSPKAYSSLLKEELNYLILGENSPQQGFGATLNNEKTELKLNGVLTDWNKSILTVEANFSATDGVYFFNNNEKSGKSSKIAFNYFKQISSLTRSVYIDKAEEVKTTKSLLVQQLLFDYAGKFNSLLNILEDKKVADDKTSISLPINTELRDKAIEKIKELFNDYILNLNFDSNNTYSFDLKEYTKIQKNRLNVNGSVYDFDTKYNLAKVYKDYREAVSFINNKLENEISKLEIKTVAKQWTSHKITYWGLNGFYERENFDRFSYDATKTFSKMFSNEKGDLFGGELSLNFAYLMGTRNSKWQMDKFFVTASVGLNRSSNFSSFKNSTLSNITGIGNDVNNTSINTIGNKSAFTGSTIYDYGFGSEISLNFYLFPREEVPLGIFAEFSHRYVDFGDDSLAENLQITPLRLGLLLNLKNKEKDKPIFTLSFFVDRTDLSKTPNDPDEDMRIGLGLGIPINFK